MRKQKQVIFHRYTCLMVLFYLVALLTNLNQKKKGIITELSRILIITDLYIANIFFSEVV